MPPSDINHRLAVSVTSPNGRVKRWGSDEPDVADIPGDTEITTRIPGGYGTFSCSLLRDLRLDWTDARLFNRVRAYGAGNKTAFDGRLWQTPGSIGSSLEISPSAIGMASYLKDGVIREIYADYGIAGWSAPSAARQAQLLAGTPAYKLTDAQVQGAPDPSGAPAVILSMSRVSTTAGSIAQMAEAQYNSQGIPIGALYYDQTQYDLGNAKGQLAAGWGVQAVIGDNDVFGGTGPVTSGNLQGAASSSYLTTTLTSRTVAALQMWFANTIAADGEWRVYWRNPAVYGTHGLTRRGSNPQGFYASDIMANIVSRTAPKLRYTTGPGGSIEQTNWVIRNLSFMEPTNGEDAILTANKWDNMEWGVYDDYLFFYRTSDPARLTWEARFSEGATMTFEGDVGDNIYNQVMVVYDDPQDGQTKTVGAPGSAAQFTDSRLQDTSPDNPLNEWGETRVAILRLSFPAVYSDAVQLGQIWMLELALPSRRGQITLSDGALHPTEGWVPTWRVRAGDYITVADNPNDVPRRIVATTYNHGARTVSCDVGIDVAKVETMFERIGVSLIGVA